MKGKTVGTIAAKRMDVAPGVEQRGFAAARIGLATDATVKWVFVKSTSVSEVSERKTLTLMDGQEP